MDALFARLNRASANEKPNTCDIEFGREIRALVRQNTVRRRARTPLHQPPLVGRRVRCLTDHSFLPHSAPFDVRLDWQLADDCGTRSNFARAPAEEKRRKTTDTSPSTSKFTEFISHTYERRRNKRPIGLLTPVWQVKWNNYPNLFTKNQFSDSWSARGNIYSNYSDSEVHRW